MARRRREPARQIEWNFVSFPVLFAFAAGSFITMLLVPFLGWLLFVVSLFGVSFCLAHVFSHWFRRRSRDRALERAEEEERERRALAARAAAARTGEAASAARRRRRRRT